jgi:hypothetical protein
MATKEKTVRVRMLGNHRHYDNGKTYDMPEAEAIELAGIGVGIIELAAPPAKEE